MKVAGTSWPVGMVGHGDGMSGMSLAGGICAALLARERSGQDAIVDGSLLGTAAWFNGHVIMWSQLEDGMRPQTRDRAMISPGSNTYETKDGRFIRLLLLNDEQSEWADLCQHLGRPDLIADERFLTRADRLSNAGVGTQIFDELFAQRTLAEWKEALSTVRAVWAAVQTPSEVIDDAQVVANRMIRQVSTPRGVLTMPVPPVLFDEDGGEPVRAPEWAEHTDEVLTDIGFSAERIGALRTSKVIA
jgi:crotonobetainyl-CoA:carnitine CoA-transferase CaiB-like acyl-CoA transferase